MNEQVIPYESAVNEEELQKKEKAYAGLGKKVYLAELVLIAKAQTAIKSIEVKPKSIDEVPEAERRLREFVSTRVQLTSERKQVTDLLKPVFDRMMNPEKSLEAPEKEFRDSIIACKQAHEAAEAKKLQIETAKKNLIEAVKKRLADLNAKNQKKITDAVHEIYVIALESDIKPGDIESWITSHENKFGVTDFHEDKPAFTGTLLTVDQITEIVNEAWTLNANAFVTVYQRSLREAFLDYGIAYQNKQDALANSQKQVAAAKVQIEEERQDANVAASLEASSTSLEPELFATPVRALKKFWEINMPETLDSAIAIMGAFVANKQACLKKLKVTKFFSLTPAQMGKALCELKNDDEKFQPANIVFKESAKL